MNLGALLFASDSSTAKAAGSGASPIVRLDPVGLGHRLLETSDGVDCRSADSRKAK